VSSGDARIVGDWAKVAPVENVRTTEVKEELLICRDGGCSDKEHSLLRSSSGFVISGYASL
jgi:hypothetical protein